MPFPVYFALGRFPLPPEAVEKLESSNGELCHNLYYLGKRTQIKTSEGIKIAALGGVLDPDLDPAQSKDNYTPSCNVGDAEALRSANGADILITHTWPERIRKNSNVAFDCPADKTPLAHRSIAELSTALRPRYHFSNSSNTFYEREPFFHINPPDVQEDGFAVTRFISLASFGNPAKQKWIYAFSLDPTAAPPVTVPQGTTASPLALPPKAPRGMKRHNPDDPQTSNSFSRFSADSHPDHFHSRKKRRQPPPGPNECFFCLANPRLATHLVVSIGQEAYITTSKGPLTTKTTFPELGGEFPAHALIIPLPHVPTLAAIPEPETRQATLQEMQRLRDSLHQMLAHRAGGRLGAVTWEVRRAGGVHGHWQFLPIPVDMIRKGLVEVAFKVQAENEKYPPFVESGTADDDGDDGDCFKVWIWQPANPNDVAHEREDHTSDAMDVSASDASHGAINGANGHKSPGLQRGLTLPIDPSIRFDLQMGRRVLGKLLGLEDRTHWQECHQTEQEETAEATAFREAFKEFDFTLEGE